LAALRARRAAPGAAPSDEAAPPDDAEVPDST